MDTSFVVVRYAVTSWTASYCSELLPLYGLSNYKLYFGARRLAFNLTSISARDSVSALAFANPTMDLRGRRNQHSSTDVISYHR